MSIFMIVLYINTQKERTDLLSTMVATPELLLLSYLFQHPGEFWYFTKKLSAETGFIRNISLLLNPSGDMFVPHQGWQYVNTSMQYTDLGCATVR